MDPLIHANLYLTGPRQFDPAVITERTGLTMDWGISLGDVRTTASGSAGPLAKYSMWVHSSGEFERTFALEGVLNRFLDRIEAVAANSPPSAASSNSRPTSR